MKTPSQRGRASRRKGIRFEAEVAEIFSSRLGRDVRRNLGQERDGGCDLNVPPLKIECKRRAVIGVSQWYHEANVASGADQIPAVVMRGDGEPPMILLRVDDFLRLCGETLR